MGIELQDRMMTCTVCNSKYVFTKDEQQFFIRKALEEPRRCKKCRRKKRKEFAKRRKKLMASLSKAEIVKVEVTSTIPPVVQTAPIKKKEILEEKVDNPVITSDTKTEERVKMGLVPVEEKKEGKKESKKEGKKNGS